MGKYSVAVVFMLVGLLAHVHAEATRAKCHRCGMSMQNSSRGKHKKMNLLSQFSDLQESNLKVAALEDNMSFKTYFKPDSPKDRFQRDVEMMSMPNAPPQIPEGLGNSPLPPAPPPEMPSSGGSLPKPEGIPSPLVRSKRSPHPQKTKSTNHVPDTSYSESSTTVPPGAMESVPEDTSPKPEETPETPSMPARTRRSPQMPGIPSIPSPPPVPPVPNPGLPEGAPPIPGVPSLQS